MINIANVKYDLSVLLPDGSSLPLTNVARGLRWEEQAGEISVRLEFSVLNQKMGDEWLHMKIPLGGRTILQADWGEGWREIHQGTIFDWKYENESLGILNVKSYDMLIHLLRSKDDRWYPAGTQARVILEDISKAWNIPIGQNDLPSMKLAAQPFRNQTLANMKMSVLDQVAKRGGGKHIIRASDGQVHIMRRGQNQPVYYFGSDIVRRMSDQHDIEELVTRIKIIGKENKKGRSPILATMDGRTEFGILQEVVYSQQYDTAAAAKTAAQEILKERGQPRKRRSITAPDLPFLRRGDKVYLSTGTLEGYFFVEGIQHDADNRIMVMEVEE